MLHYVVQTTRSRCRGNLAIEFLKLTSGNKNTHAMPGCAAEASENLSDDQWAITSPTRQRHRMKEITKWHNSLLDNGPL